jgi:hypothetical protein
MMKKSIFTFAFLALMAFASAQSLQFELDGYVFANGEKVICTHVEEWGEIVQEMQVHNLTDAPIDVMIRREVVQNVEGTQNSFCWGTCYSPLVDVSTRPQSLEAGAVSVQGLLSFHQAIASADDPNVFITGTSISKYYAYPANNEADQVCIEVWFAYGAESINENEVVLGHAYPNPASSVVRFDYELPSVANASVSVYNLLGQEVLKQDLTSLQGQAVLSVADLTEGIYFCNLKVDGRTMKTEKFIVRK